MADSVHVYNPDDEEDRHTFNGLVLRLLPNQTTDLGPLVREAAAAAPARWEGLTAEHAADHVVAELGRFGVCRTRGEVLRDGEAWACEDPEDEQTVREAEATYDRVTRAWAVEHALTRHDFEQRHAAAGVAAPPPTADQARARAWLETHPTPAQAG